MWMVFAALIVLALMFVVWPWSKLHAEKKAQSKRLVEDQNQQALNVQLYQERIKELESQLNAQELSQEDFDSLTKEAAKTLLSDTEDAQSESVSQVDTESSQSNTSLKSAWPLLTVVVALPVAAVLWYNQMGASEDMVITELIEAKFADQRNAMEQGRAPNPEFAENVIDAIEKRLESDPENIQYWYLLARENMRISHYQKAAKSYRQILTLTAGKGQEEPEVLAQLAQAEFFIAGNQINPGIVNLVERALEHDPKNATALGLAGIAAFQEKNYVDAIRHWQDAVRVIGTSSPGAQTLLGGIMRAEQLLIASGGEPVTPVLIDKASANTGSDESSGGKSVTVKVDLTEEVKQQAMKMGDLTVFIYARAHPNGRMPLAIQRVVVSDLPLTVTLTDAMAMAPGSTISTANNIELVARISQKGSPRAEAGDWEKISESIDVSSLNGDEDTLYTLMIDSQL